MNSAKFLRTPFQQNTCRRLLLDLVYLLKFETKIIFQFKATSLSLQFESLKNRKIFYHQIKISERYNEQIFKKAVLKNFAIFTEKYLR